MISTLIYILFVIVSVVLVLVVLIQDEHGEGLGGIFGGGSTTPFGSRSGNVLTRFTTYTAVIFFIVIFALALLNRSPTTGNPEALAEQRIIEQEVFQREETDMGIIEQDQEEEVEETINDQSESTPENNTDSIE